MVKLREYTLFSLPEIAIEHRIISDARMVNKYLQVVSITNLLKDKNCPENEIISSLDTCKEASKTLKLEFHNEFSGIGYPSGCFCSSHPLSIFNAITHSNYTEPGNFLKRGGICLKTGRIHLYNHLSWVLTNTIFTYIFIYLKKGQMHF